MDFVYAPPPPAAANTAANKQEKAGSARGALLLGLPTHLPNSLPTHIPNSLPTHIPNSVTTDVPNSAPTLSHSSVNLHPAAEEETGNEEDEENPPKEVVFIQGTNISLQTEEDIAKWIEERKKRWPSRKNVEAKKDQRPAKRSLPQDNEPSKKQKNVCKFFAQHNRCKFGNKCKNVHEQPDQQPSANTKVINGMAVHVPQRFHNEMYSKETAGKSLYKMLVQKDLYEHENNEVLEFLRFLEERLLIDHDVVI